MGHVWFAPLHAMPFVVFVPKLRRANCPPYQRQRKNELGCDGEVAACCGTTRQVGQPTKRALEATLMIKFDKQMNLWHVKDRTPRKCSAP